MNNYCRHCDLFIGYGAAGICLPPDDKDADWLRTHCWGCGKSESEIHAPIIPAAANDLRLFTLVRARPRRQFAVLI